ncbi:MAG: hypothetical protein AAB869_02550 [Patescibacteria group bacterium]
MRISRDTYKWQLVLGDANLVAEILAFPEHGVGYSLVDVLLKDGTTVEQVPIVNGDTAFFFDDMRQFKEDEIANVTVSQA